MCLFITDRGIEFWDDEESLKLFKDAGATVKGNRVCFDKGHALELCKTAPREFEMHARNPKRSTIFGGNRLIFGPAYGPPFVYDIKKGRRQGTMEDFINLMMEVLTIIKLMFKYFKL